jgi:glycosyltransferase involved in cell wall biosynthesis
MGTLHQSGSPKVTVVTPVFNVGRYIGEAVDSVMCQTFADFEYILVDDGSTDNSVDVVRAHAGDDPRVRLVLGKHRGAAAARNVGIRESKAKYIACLDSDDRWHPKFLERQVALIESLPPDVGAVFCRSRMILENGTPIFFQWQRAGRYDFDDFLIGTNPARNGSSLLIRSACFDDVGDFDEALQYVEDFEMWLRIAKGSKTPLFWASRHFLVDLRLRPGSVTRERAGGEAALLDLLEVQTPKLQRLPPGLAYVRPAVAALKYGGNDDLAERWAVRAREAGTSHLIRSAWGLRLLFWHSLPRSGRRAMRSVQSHARNAVKSANLHLRGGASVT